MTGVDIFAGVDMYGATVRTLTININNRCPLRCRHCAVGDSLAGASTASAYRIEEDVLLRQIDAIDPSYYDMLLLAGGEPSLEPALITAAIRRCRERGLLSAIVSAPVWARSPELAGRLLDKIAGLDVLVLSYDIFHLEFLEPAHYRTAVDAAFERGIRPLIHCTYASDEELAVLERIDDLRTRCDVSTMRAVPVGAAADITSVPMPTITVETEDDLDRIPRGCVAGNVFLDEAGRPHGCCWSRTIPNSPLSVAGDTPVASALSELEARPHFQAVRASGFLGALTPAGRANLTARVRGQSFANECHICLTSMSEDTQGVWSQMVDRSIMV